MAHGQPAVDDGTVYVLSKHHEVLALDTDTGAARWRRSTLEPGDTTTGSAVVVSGDVVVAGDYNLAALDRRTGELRWRFVPAIGYAPGIYLGDSAGGLVLAGSPAGRLYAVSTSTGESRWTAVLANDGRTTVFRPVTDGMAVAIGYTTFVAPSAGGVALFDVATGRELWRAALPRAPDPLLGAGSAGGPVLTERLVIAASGDGRIYAFDRADGAIRWTLPAIDYIPPLLQGPFPMPVPAGGSGADYRPLVIIGRTLVAGSLKGHVIAYDLETLREQWRYFDERSGSVSFGLAADERAVYVPFYSGRHVALSLRSGGEVWRTHDPADGFNWPAASDRRRVYLAGDKGGYVAIER